MDCTNCKALENGQCRLQHRLRRKIVDRRQVSYTLEDCENPHTQAELIAAIEEMESA